MARTWAEGTGFSLPGGQWVVFWGDRNALGLDKRCRSHKILNVLHGTELTLKWLILCVVNCTSIKSK